MMSDTELAEKLWKTSLSKCGISIFNNTGKDFNKRNAEIDLKRNI